MDDIARFGAYLSDEKHSSRNTVSSYLRDTTQFAEYLHNYCDIDLREADSAAVQDYMDWMPVSYTHLTLPTILRV